MSLLSSSSIWKRGQDQASQFNTDSTQTRKGAKRKKPTWMFSLSLKKRIEITHFGLKIKDWGFNYSLGPEQGDYQHQPLSVYAPSPKIWRDAGLHWQHQTKIIEAEEEFCFWFPEWTHWSVMWLSLGWRQIRKSFPMVRKRFIFCQPFCRFSSLDISRKQI